MWKTRKSVRLTHHFREEFIIVKMAIREKFTRLKKIFTPVPVGWVGGLVGGRVRKAKNKAKAQHSWGLGLAELGNRHSRNGGAPLKEFKISDKIFLYRYI